MIFEPQFYFRKVQIFWRVSNLNTLYVYAQISTMVQRLKNVSTVSFGPDSIQTPKQITVVTERDCTERDLAGIPIHPQDRN